MKKAILISFILIFLLGLISSAYAYQSFTNGTIIVELNISTNHWFNEYGPVLNFTVYGNDTAYNCTPWTILPNGSWFKHINNTAGIPNATSDGNISVNTTYTDNNTGIRWTIECMGNVSSNSTENPKKNATARTFFIDTLYPTAPTIGSYYTNASECVDGEPQIEFSNTTEVNFLRYKLYFAKLSNESVNKTVYWYGQFNNWTSGGGNDTIKLNITLPENNTGYNLTITAIDQSGQENASDTFKYIHNNTGYYLRAGWNLYGIVRGGDVNLSDIATETGASTVSWYNNSRGAFVSHTAGTTTNDAFNVNRIGSVGDNVNNAVFLYMDSGERWRGCGRNFSTSEDYSWDYFVNNTNNQWNVISVKKLSGYEFDALNTTWEGTLFDVLSYYNSTSGKYISYFANTSFNNNTLLERGNALWIRWANSTSANFNWTNQTTG